MELLLERDYHPLGTDGILSCNDEFICFTIELPWRDNRRMISCIPEGRYRLVLRFSDRHRWHLMLKDVPGRTLILVHKANNALKELKGCIAPVTRILSPGIGTNSRAAFSLLMKKIRPCLDAGERVWLTVKNLSDRYHSLPVFG